MHQVLLFDMKEIAHPPEPARAFKTAWFTKAARKARIPDKQLCTAVRQAMQGQVDDLGGGVFKKRLNDNMHRSIVLAKGGRYWTYESLFAKKGRDNIEAGELESFRALAKACAGLSPAQVAQLLKDKDLVEICHDDQAQVQK